MDKPVRPVNPIPTYPIVEDLLCMYELSRFLLVYVLYILIEATLLRHAAVIHKTASTFLEAI